jgi:hypothetical protein
MNLHALARAKHGCNDEEDREQDEVLAHEPCQLRCHRCHPLSLEPEILQCLCSTAVHVRRAAVIAAALGEVALRDPRGRAV